MERTAIRTAPDGVLGAMTNSKVLIVSLLAWTLTNMDQAFFAYAIPGILLEFNLPLEAVGIILTISS